MSQHSWRNGRYFRETRETGIYQNFDGGARVALSTHDGKPGLLIVEGILGSIQIKADDTSIDDGGTYVGPGEKKEFRGKTFFFYNRKSSVACAGKYTILNPLEDVEADSPHDAVDKKN